MKISRGIHKDSYRVTGDDGNWLGDITVSDLVYKFVPGTVLGYTEDQLRFISDRMNELWMIHLLSVDEKFQQLKQQYKLAYIIDYDFIYENEEPTPRYVLGYIGDTGEFVDFYYDSGLQYEEWQCLVPRGFCEESENWYSYIPRGLVQDLGWSAEDQLKQFGYQHFDDYGTLKN